MDGASLEALAALTKALDRKPDAEEAVAWAAMAPIHRETAIKRLEVLRRWTHDRDGLTAGDAADALGIKISRFYDLAARWSAGSRRLFDVGRFARSQSGRKGRFDADLLNELQAQVSKIVGGNTDASVSRQVELLIAAVDAKGRALPSTNSLRAIVERERRRLVSRRQTATEIGLDSIGTGLARQGGGQHVAYAIIDRTSRLVMGAALGPLDDSVAGYASAAVDSLRWMGSPDAAGVPWTAVTERVDVVPGGDADRWRSLDRSTCPVELGLADGRRSQGGYFRKFVGPFLGRLKLRPANAMMDDAAGDVVDEELAGFRLRVEVANHNAAIMAEMAVTGEPRPAPTTTAALEWIGRLPRELAG